MKDPIINDDVVLKQFAIKLKEQRENKRLTQSEVAEKAGLSVNHYAKIERGEVEPGSITLIRIIDSLGIEYSDVLPKLT